MSKPKRCVRSSGSDLRDELYAHIWHLREERDAATSLREMAILTREIDEETARLGRLLSARPALLGDGQPFGVGAPQEGVAA